MEAATCSQRLSLRSPIDSERFIRKPNGFLTMSYGSKEDQRLRMLVSRNLGRSTVQIREKLVPFVPSCCVKNTQAPALETERTYDSIGVPLTLKKKSQDVAPYLSGRCIYLVGMMGSGKTTVGKILSKVLGYSFIDSDKLVEEAVNGISVAQIFEKFSESFFRDNESEALRKLSVMHHLVVATGGGAVIRPINWRYMKQGITVWLDVPIEALARRIAAVGTDSRPLLHNEVGDAYTKALQRLSSLYEERGEAYANADATVSLECAAAKLDLVDVCDLSPTDIALEVLVQIENFLHSGKDKAAVARK